SKKYRSISIDISMYIDRYQGLGALAMTPLFSDTRTLTPNADRPALPTNRSSPTKLAGFQLMVASPETDASNPAVTGPYLYSFFSPTQVPVSIPWRVSWK